MRVILLFIIICSTVVITVVTLIRFARTPHLRAYGCLLPARLHVYTRTTLHPLHATVAFHILHADCSHGYQLHTRCAVYVYGLRWLRTQLVGCYARALLRIRVPVGTLVGLQFTVAYGFTATVVVRLCLWITTHAHFKFCWLVSWIGYRFLRCSYTLITLRTRFRTVWLVGLRIGLRLHTLILPVAVTRFMPTVAVALPQLYIQLRGWLRLVTLLLRYVYCVCFTRTTLVVTLLITLLDLDYTPVRYVVVRVCVTVGLRLPDLHVTVTRTLLHHYVAVYVGYPTLFTLRYWLHVCYVTHLLHPRFTRYVGCYTTLQLVTHVYGWILRCRLPVAFSCYAQLHTLWIVTRLRLPRLHGCVVVYFAFTFVYARLVTRLFVYTHTLLRLFATRLHPRARVCATHFGYSYRVTFTFTHTRGWLRLPFALHTLRVYVCVYADCGYVAVDYVLRCTRLPATFRLLFDFAAVTRAFGLRTVTRITFQLVWLHAHVVAPRILHADAGRYYVCVTHPVDSAATFPVHTLRTAVALFCWLRLYAFCYIAVAHTHTRGLRLRYTRCWLPRCYGWFTHGCRAFGSDSLDYRCCHTFAVTFTVTRGLPVTLVALVPVLPVYYVYGLVDVVVVVTHVFVYVYVPVIAR